MGQWVGSARTNYVRIADLGGLLKSLARFEAIEVQQLDGKFCFVARGEFGDWPYQAIPHNDESEQVATDDNIELEFSFERCVMPFIADGEVLVAMAAGHEAPRYVTGYASALVRRGSDTRAVHVTLDDIYNLASIAFGITRERITLAECG